MAAQEAYVTLLTNNSYIYGALVLGQSLRQTKTTKALVTLVTDSVSNEMRALLSEIFDEVITVDLIDSNDEENLSLLNRKDLGSTLTKIQCWTLVQYSKCVFLDADTLVLQNIDDLFVRPEFSAAPDAGWPDCFNSGVFVFEPSLDTFDALQSLASECGSFDGADQGLLNQFFRNWSTADKQHRLPFTYNASTQTFYTFLPALKQFGDDVKVAHFLGPLKPWHQSSSEASTRAPWDRFTNTWWDVYFGEVQTLVQKHMSSSVPFIVPRIKTEKYKTPYPWSLPKESERFSEEARDSFTDDRLRSYSGLEAFYAEAPMSSVVDAAQSEQYRSASSFQGDWSSHATVERTDYAAERVGHEENPAEARKAEKVVAMERAQLQAVPSGANHAETARTEGRRRWEQEGADYLGSDAFLHIQAALIKSLEAEEDTSVSSVFSSTETSVDSD